MASLQRSAISFRRQGSSGLIWDDRLFLSGDLSLMRHREEASTEFGGLRRSQSFDPAATLRMEHSRRPNGEQLSRPQKVAATSEPPSPKPSRCFCPFSRKPNK